jgi:hypothetical protein
LGVALADAAEQEDLVLHREAEEDSEQEQRDPGVDRFGGVESEEFVADSWKTMTSRP